MLDAEDRTLLTDLIGAPDGFELDQAIGTTYSLDLVALAGVPLACFRLEASLVEEMDSNAAVLAGIECVRRNMPRFSVFCQAGAIKVPTEFRDIFLWLERSLVEVSPGQGVDRGVFHPKVWILRFVGAGQAVRYRVAVLSRNLTYDRSWDVATCVEADLDQTRVRSVGATAPLVDFVRALGSTSLRGETLEDIHAARIDLFCDELRRITFAPPEDTESVRFWPIGIDGHRHTCKGLFSRRSGPFGDFVECRDKANRHFLAVSPFVSRQFVGELLGLGDKHRTVSLVSREMCLDELGEALPLENDGSQGSIESWSFDSLGNDTESDDETLSGLHAKMYVADDGHKAHVWMGSANATDAAFGRNVEFLLQITGSKSAMGIATLLEADKDAEGRGFADLVRRYHSRVEPDAEQILRQKLESELGYVLIELAARKALAARVEMTGSGFDLQLRMTRKVDPSVQVAAWPITFTAEEASANHAGKGWGLGDVLFAAEALTLAQLTEFWCVAARKDDVVVRRVIKVPTPTMPDLAQREADVVGRHLRDLDALSQYLEFLLAGNSREFVRSLRRRRRNGRTPPGAEPEAAPIFETLLLALATNRSALTEIDDQLRRMSTANDVLATDAAFRRLWDSVQVARAQMERLA